MGASVRVYLRTFGCRANQYDSEAVRALVERGGGEMVADPASADVAIFNSCAVTAEAEVDLRKSVRRAARQRPELRTVVMGCASALDRGVIRSLPTVSHVLPGADFAGVAEALDLPPSALAGVPSGQTGTRALLRIQDGCDEHCTFCATTLARGANRSRHASDLVREAKQLAGRHPEIVLTGIHIGSWGADIGSSLGRLVQALVTEVPEARFRLSSLEATEVDDGLLEMFDEPAHLVPHLHAPLQSGADRILKRMGRHWYTAESYTRAVERIAARRPVFGLGADVIAGFPGESEADHATTLSLVERLPFTYLHVFPYSPRPGTAAERLPAPVDGHIAQRRARDLREAAERKARAYSRTRSGGSADVVVVRGEAREGLTGDYLTVSVDGDLPRGTRFTAKLAWEGQALRAHPSAAILV
jgi:threonylcarbamoyladenosine tRNA methylthiotransferase MtaB